MILAYIGGYDPAYPRNAVLRAGLTRLGITLHPLFVPRRAGVLARGAALVAAVGQLDPAPDVVLVAEFCHKDVPAAWLAARRARAVLAADPLISRADTMVGEWELYRSGSLDAWACARWDRVAFRWPAVVVADTEVHARRFAGAADRIPFPVVYVGADDAFFDLPDLEPAPGPFTVLYAGGFLPLHAHGPARARWRTACRRPRARTRSRRARAVAPRRPGSFPCRGAEGSRPRTAR